MSFNVAVAEGLKSFAMFGVKGGVTHPAGQFERPVSCASSEGKGSGTPEPLEGKLKLIWSVAGSSCVLMGDIRSSNGTMST
jgi:hypothetical protein